jgi:hypothetical protein
VLRGLVEVEGDWSCLLVVGRTEGLYGKLLRSLKADE